MYNQTKKSQYSLAIIHIWQKIEGENVILQFDTQMSADCLTSYADYFSNFVTSLEF